MVTKGWALPEGRRVITKLHALNNHFSTRERLSKLANVQIERRLPQLRPVVDVDVRVASTCKLMRRSMLNFHAYRAFFASAAPGNEFTAISAVEWALISELEGITHPLSNLVLTEVQKQLMVASYMVYFRQTAEAKLSGNIFMCHDYQWPSYGTTDATITRETRQADGFSDPAKRCIQRTLAQLRDRFPAPDVDAAMALLLDPRTKDCAQGIVEITMGRKRL